MIDERSTTVVLAEWNRRLSTALEIPAADIDAVLELAGVIAHSVVRPAAPITAYLVGYSAGLAAGNRVSDAGESDAIAVARTLATETSL
jgi:hypothetical protein